MLYWLIIFVGFLLLFALAQWLIAVLKRKNIKINRWVWAWAAFLVMIIPYAIWPHLNNIVSAILYGLCAICAITFMIEEHSYFLVKGHM
ncbi:diacylglycerol kinase [Lacticaseibacillus porcinae]|uniref:diacylglycerol kinase n=1 Tax=Lacticaseibacillus porcinae TaxID=1123687 RepID=UPI000F76605B|nr:diacylglycerol kinase [Lacticaseibacillus porcinae]